MMAKDPYSPYLHSTNVGSIIAKNYSVVIYMMFDDHAKATVMESSGGKGMKKRAQAVKNRSMYVVEAGRLPKYKDSPKPVLETHKNSRFRPLPGTFLDPTNTIKIAYDTDFVPAGYLTNVSKEYLMVEKLKITDSSLSRSMPNYPAVRQHLNAARQANGEDLLNGSNAVDTSVAASRASSCTKISRAHKHKTDSTAVAPSSAVSVPSFGTELPRALKRKGSETETDLRSDAHKSKRSRTQKPSKLSQV
ncbi:hypothetical protein Ptr902_10003 [Pyrenophora tritici-repentis]|nr:hypothetical protein Ptr902_10003 [Pyrenophora tritici-repentis]